MESEAPQPAGAGMEEVLRDLRDAIEFREAEHARRNANRVLFSRAVMLYSLGIIAGVLMLGRVFDPQVFKERLYARLQGDAPRVLDRVGSSLKDLAPVYRDEVGRSLPGFSESVAAEIAVQAGQLTDVARPLAAGDFSTAMDSADQMLADQLLARFGPELHSDRNEALALARAFRAEELKGGPAAASHELGGALGTLDEIGSGLRSLGPPDTEVFHGSDIVDALGSTALDVVKMKIMSGELGFRGQGHAPPPGAH